MQAIKWKFIYYEIINIFISYNLLKHYYYCVKASLLTPDSECQI